MKVGTLTYHDTRNYGAVLQAYALQRTIENLGVDCEIIDYKSEYLNQVYKIKSFNDIKSIKEFIKWILTITHDKKSKLKFDKFNETKQKFSIDSYTKENISEVNNIYDCFFVGSDQVWNLNLNDIDTTYFLDFVSDNDKKFSYAASFGYKSVPNNYLDITTKNLNLFKKIAVREEQGKHIIENMLGKTAQVVLDPTLLLEKESWSKIEENINTLNKDYILVYSVAATPSLFEFAKKLSKEKNCEIIYINRSYINKLGMKNIRSASPEEFLGYISGAKYIVTSSFHGVAFALNYKKEFFYELDTKPQNNNSRLESIIDIVGLKDREIINGTNNKVDENIDYNKVDSILKEERSKSINYLNDIIKSIKKVGNK
ncbi:polysaccharide pyruvyl transferase family protein [Romboutsia timonensis]|uniref:polysaccharide pyruvyl transferase family protein n=1 Tax=Romboutsia timonensis TaxID=1776391 RepID=UPI002A80F990|nr:polysaccharide pyruvyl transferase family protein [Romboutsia timonensis]MDY3959686.1 polysaccharide pyruvyl transferase family protein [Romboutsia timonensis]